MQWESGNNLQVRPMCLKKLLLRRTDLFLPFPPSPSYNNLLNSCSSFQDLKCVHAQILTHGLSQNLLFATKLIALTCSFAPAMNNAHKLFDEIPHPYAFAWNTLIRGYADLDPCEQALLLYKQMHISGLSPDHFTFSFVVRSCTVLSALREGREVRCNVIKNGFNSDAFVQSLLVSMYAQNGEALSSQLVFDEMGVKNIVSRMAMIAGYVQNGFYLKSLDVFRRMVISGTQPNAVTLVSILPACVGLKYLKLGLLIHESGIKLGLDSNLPLVNYMIALYGKCGDVEIARSLFDSMGVRNIVSWNAMIATYEQNDMDSKAIKRFQKMQNEKVEFDNITMVSIISACASLGALNTGKWVHELANSKGLESNVAVTVALVDMDAKCGSIDLARNVFDKLPRKGVVSWSAMIGAYAAHGHGEDALRLFSKMQREGVKPNSFTCTSLLTACRHSGLVEEGMRQFNSMRKDYLIVPGVEHCALKIVGLGVANLISGLFVIVHNLRELKNEPHNSMDQGGKLDRYLATLGRREHFPLHATVAVLSYILLGLLRPVIYGFSFRKSDNKEYKLIAVAAASLLCITLLAIGKTHV